jgi:plasmid stabilization system protein ParE
MRVVFSRLALDELDRILAEIAKANPDGARRVEARLRSAFNGLRENPHSAQRVAKRPNVRRAPLVRYPYSIYYEPESTKAPVFGNFTSSDWCPGV